MDVPELPEVETVRRTLTGLVKGKTIKSVEIRWPNIIKRPAEPEEFARKLTGETIQSIGRRESFTVSFRSLCHGFPPSNGREIRASSSGGARR